MVVQNWEVWQFLKKVNVHLSYVPDILLFIYLREINAYVDRNPCTQMFIAVVFIIAKSENKSNIYQYLKRKTNCHVSIQCNTTTHSRGMN